MVGWKAGEGGPLRGKRTFEGINVIDLQKRKVRNVEKGHDILIRD